MEGALSVICPPYTLRFSFDEIKQNGIVPISGTTGNTSENTEHGSVGQRNEILNRRGDD
jgi:hypothetical protein